MDEDQYRAWLEREDARRGLQERSEEYTERKPWHSSISEENKPRGVPHWKPSWHRPHGGRTDHLDRLEDDE